MAGKKTSAEQSKEEQKDAQVGNLLDAAFGDLGGLQKPPEEDVVEMPETIEQVVEEEAPVVEIEEKSLPSEEEVIHDAKPSGPPGSPPTGPPSGPPCAAAGSAIHGPAPGPRALARQAA